MASQRSHARSIYLDANATEPLRPVAKGAMLAAPAGNPSSIHGPGRAARRTVEEARESLLAGLGAVGWVGVFGSGGTEANAAAIHALRPGRRLLVGATEHDAVRATGADTVLGVDATGRVRLDELERLLRPGPALVCLMLANNETGVLHPVPEAAAMCRAHGAWLHVDAVQAAGRMAVDAVALGADSMAISSHKLGGPGGAGLLLLARPSAPRPLIAGGGQEGGWRGGTPPVAAIAGFAAALTPARPDLRGLRDAIEAAARSCGARVVGAEAPRLPNTTCLVLPGVAAQTQVMTLDLAGIAVSAGSACSSGKVARSHVLDAMGLGEEAGQAIRISLPWNAEPEDVAAFATAYAAMAARLAPRLR